MSYRYCFCLKKIKIKNIITISKITDLESNKRDTVLSFHTRTSVKYNSDKADYGMGAWPLKCVQIVLKMP